MSDDPIRQRRDGAVLCAVDQSAEREAAFLPSADASSSAFAFAVRMRPSLSRDDDAIGSAWAARVVRKASGANAVRVYDERGAWSTPMEEAFAAGFVAFLRGAAWGGHWPAEAAHWRTQLAAAIASCRDGIEEREVAGALDDAMRAMYARLVVLASKLGALPFAAPEASEMRPYADPAAQPSGATFRKQSSTVGPPGVASAQAPAAKPAAATAFSTLDEPRPGRFLVPALVVATGLALAVIAVTALYFTVFRPGSAEAARAADATIEQLRDRQFSKIYDNGAAILRHERWPEFGARAKRPENLGRMLEVTPQGPPTIERIPGVGRTATVLYDAKHVFGTVSLICRYVDVGFIGEWKLAELGVAVRPEVADPPFPATPEGADALARRFLFAFQQSDFGAIEALVPGVEDRQRVVSFRNTLIGDGFITKIERTELSSEMLNGRSFQTATYTIETNRDQRSGTLKFLLIENGPNWTVAGMESNMSFRY